MNKVIINGVVLAIALAGAFYTYQHRDDVPTDSTKVAMYQAAEGDVQKITWKADDLTVSVEHKKDASGEYVWVSTREEIKKAKPPVPDGDTDDTDAGGAEPAAEVEVKETAFLGNDAAEKLYAAFSPLMAMRELAADQPTDPKTFGFDEPKATLTVEKGGQTIEMVLGAETYGARDRYIKQGDRVFLVDDQDLRPLQYGKTRLVERALQPFVEKDLETILVRDAAGTSVNFVQKNREDREKAYWARDSAPDVSDEIGATWLDKLLKVRAQGYPMASELPAALTPMFSYTVSGRKDGASQSWTVEVSKNEADGEFYAKSSYDRATVKLTKSMAAEAVDDLASALSGTGALPVEGTPPAPTPPLEHP
jgi:hypothetical protein